MAKRSPSRRRSVGVSSWPPTGAWASGWATRSTGGRSSGDPAPPDEATLAPAGATPLPAMPGVRRPCSWVSDATRTGYPQPSPRQEVRHHLGVAVLVAGRAEGDQLHAIRAGLDPALDLRRHPQGVPLAQLDDLVVAELAARAAAQHDVDLLLLTVAMAERHAKSGGQAEEAEARGLQPQRRPREAGLHVRRVAEAHGAVLDVVDEVHLRVVGHRAFPLVVKRRPRRAPAPRATGSSRAPRMRSSRRPGAAGPPPGARRRRGRSAIARARGGAPAARR